MSATDQSELARREARAQHGIIEFAEEMQAIRDNRLYPNALKNSGDGEDQAWGIYCRDRWDMSSRHVRCTIQALSVLRRRADSGRAAAAIGSAAAVASLPEVVQDAILDTTEKRDDVRAKAKAVRAEMKRIETQEGRVAGDDELLAVAQKAQPQAQKAKPKHKSKFTSLLAEAVALAEDAADYAQSNALTDIENEFGWSRVEKLRLHADRIAETLHRPGHVRDWDEEFGALLVTEGER